MPRLLLSRCHQITYNITNSSLNKRVNICILGIFRVQDDVNLCIYWIFWVQDNANLYIYWMFEVENNANLCIYWIFFEFVGIFRVYKDISSSFCIAKMSLSHVTHLIIRMKTWRTLSVHADIIMDVRKVDMYESKIVPKCGQFGHIFHFETTEKLFLLDKNHWLGINP